MSARLDADSERELRELRARAYGPRADIATDPIALRRLEQLEASRAAIPDSGVVSVDARSASVIADGRVEDRAGDELLDRLGDDSLWDHDPDAADAASAAAAGAADAAAGPGSAEHGAGRPARLGRKHTVLWVSSVVASAAVAALVTFAVISMQTVSTSSGAPQVDTLRLTPEGAIPPSWFGAGSDVASAEFAGLTIFETPGWTSESGDRVSDNRCLSVARTSDLPEEGEDEGDSYVGGPIYGTCGVASFPTALAMPFSDELPDELMERYPSGVAIQFVLDGDRVGVFVDSSDD